MRLSLLIAGHGHTSGAVTLWHLSVVALLCDLCVNEAYREESYLCRDASVPSVPQTDVCGRLHLIRGRPWRLVALPVRAHLQVLMDDIWMREIKKRGVGGGGGRGSEYQSAAPADDFNRKCSLRSGRRRARNTGRKCVGCAKLDWQVKFASLHEA